MKQFDSWAWSVALLAGAAVLGLLAHKLTFSVLQRLTRKTSSDVDDSFVRHLGGPARLTLPLAGVLLVLPVAGMSDALREALRHGIAIGLIGAVAWALIALLDVLDDFVSSRFHVTDASDLVARRVNTQTKILRRVVVVVVTILAGAMMLMTFPTIRQIGASLLASAGLAGLVLGMAMRSTLTNLIAGIQIALTQPIRLQDVVIVEGEWGWIEEITTTYVVVKVWDLRRLVLPLSYFVEKPFQNWTRSSTELLGTVFLYMDYTVPVQAIRDELARILKATDLWRGQVCGVQVTDSRDRVMEVRALVDARDSSVAWDLRCLVREKLIDFLQREYPQSLPRARVELAPQAQAALSYRTAG